MGVNYVPWITAVIILISKIIRELEFSNCGTDCARHICNLGDFDITEARSIYDFRLSGFPDTLLFFLSANLSV